MIGRSNARRGARRMFTVLQNKRLNQHLAYTILDEVKYFFRRATGHYSAEPPSPQLIAALFPEAFT
jgi:sorting nexin-25